MGTHSYCNACGKIVEQGRIHCDACQTADPASPVAAAGPVRKKAQRTPRRRRAAPRRTASGALGGVIGIGILLAIFVPMHSRIIDAAIGLVQGKKTAPAKEVASGEGGPGYRIVRRPLESRATPKPAAAERTAAKAPTRTRRPASTQHRGLDMPQPPIGRSPVDRSLPSEPQGSGLSAPSRPFGLPSVPSADGASLPAAPEPAEDVVAPAPPAQQVTLAKASFSFHTSYKRVLTDRTRPPGAGVPGVSERVRVYEKVPVSTKAVLRVRFDVPEDLEGLYEIRVRAPELNLSWETILIPEEVEKGVVRFTFEDVFQGGPPTKIRYRRAALWPDSLEWSVTPMNVQYGD